MTGSVVFFHGALQRMLVATRVIHHLRHFGFSNFMAENTNNGETFFMHCEHDFKGLRMVEPKEPLQHDDHKLHRCVVII